MEKAKKLRELKIGDRIWYFNYTDTTPIYVVKKKRMGDLMTVTVKWDDSEYECFGHAFGYVLTGYQKSLHTSILFSTDYEGIVSRVKRGMEESRYANIGRIAMKLLNEIRELY